MGTKEQVLAFFEKCEELKSCKFIMATSKIKDLLKCIVNCPDIYALFAEVTKNFDYPAARAQCLVTKTDGGYKRSYCVLPQQLGPKLAFCFCLFVEFDRETIDFNEFLRIYFPEDGSYFASYHAFCNTVVQGLQDAMAEVFSEELGNTAEPINGMGVNSAKSGLISAIELSISEEKQFLAASRAMPEEEKEGGMAMLTQLCEAVKNQNAPLINALICGYNYFVLYYKCVSEGIATLIQEITSFEQLL